MINVTKTYLPKREKFDKYIDQIYESAWLTNNGKLHQQLEKALCEYLNVQYLVLVSNGTLALQIAYKALGLTGEVITTPFSFVATTSSLAWENLEPVFCDIDHQSLNIDPSKIAEKITTKTSAILPVHVFGNTCEMEKIEVIAAENNLKLIYDAAHAFGVKSNSDNLYNYGDVSILSFHSTKIFHTIEGGAIIFKNKEHYDKAKLLINFGISGYDKVDTIGINCKMNEFQAAMGLAVLSEMDYILEVRKKTWENYRNYFINVPKIQLQSLNTSFSQNYSYFPVLFENEDKLLEINDLLKKENIFPRRYFYPSLNKLNYIEDSQYCPISESVAERILCLPLYPGLPCEIQDKIILIISNALK